MGNAVDHGAVQAAGAPLTVDLGALRTKYALLASRAIQAAGRRDFFAAHLPEGLALRRVLPDDADVFVLNGLQPGGGRLPTVGRVSMDGLTVDVGATPEGGPPLGDAVEMIGPGQTLDDVAARCGTIPYEILTGLGHRFDRRYVGVPGGGAGRG